MSTTTLTAKAGNLNLTFVPNAKASCVCVTVGWSMKEGNWFVLNKLARGVPCTCPELAHGSEHTSLAYSVFQHVREKLLGDAKAQQATKASSVSCGLQNDEFFICVKTIGTVSAVRKVLSVLEQSLVPSRLYLNYVANIKLLNGKPTREEFMFCANDLAKSMKSLECLVIGKAKFDKEKLALIVGSASGKFAAEEVKGGSKPASLSAKPGESEYPTIKCDSPMSAILAADFLGNVSYESIDINSKTIIVYRENWKQPKNLDKKKVEKWIMQRYGKLADLGSSLTYLAVSQCMINPSDAISFVKGSVTLQTVANLTKSAF